MTTIKTKAQVLGERIDKLADVVDHLGGRVAALESVVAKLREDLGDDLDEPAEPQQQELPVKQRTHTDNGVTKKGKPKWNKRPHTKEEQLHALETAASILQSMLKRSAPICDGGDTSLGKLCHLVNQATGFHESTVGGWICQPHRRHADLRDKTFGFEKYLDKIRPGPNGPRYYRKK